MDNACETRPPSYLSRTSRCRRLVPVFHALRFLVLLRWLVLEILLGECFLRLRLGRLHTSAAAPHQVQPDPPAGEVVERTEPQAQGQDPGRDDSPECKKARLDSA
jgi:hypothetical protein